MAHIWPKFQGPRSYGSRENRLQKIKFWNFKPVFLRNPLIYGIEKHTQDSPWGVLSLREIWTLWPLPFLWYDYLNLHRLNIRPKKLIFHKFFQTHNVIVYVASKNHTKKMVNVRGSKFLPLIELLKGYLVYVFQIPRSKGSREKRV